MTFLWIGWMTLAQTQPPAPGGGSGAETGGGGGAQLMIGLLIMFAVFYFMMFRGNPKARKERTAMLEGIKKNDRILTIGGILGTVVSVKEKEVVLKVDESTNTKMTFLKDAVRTVVKDDSDLDSKS